MEALMAVDLILKNDALVRENCRIEILIGDDDSSAIAALNRLAPYIIEKWSDFNHVLKNFTTKLYEIKVSAALREYFSKTFSTSVKKNKGDSNKVKLALQNVIPHAYGEHENCESDRQCRNVDGKYYHRYFKDGKCLTDTVLRGKLEKILQPYIEKSKQIAPCASSQVNEAWNNTVCSKHPKSAYYGGSQSHTYRVAFSVCQKNLGYEYVCSLNAKLNISPGQITKKFRKRKQEIHEYEAERKSSIPIKKRRLQLKKERSSKNNSLANKEGIAYQYGCGYLNTGDLIDEAFIFGKMVVLVSIHNIPLHVCLFLQTTMI